MLWTNLFTHLCFADDLLLFVAGSRDSIEGILRIFDEFAVCSGLTISIEKSTLYMAGINTQTNAEITSSFPFATGQFPVRYLGLPLLTKRMTKDDYTPLVERIRSQMCSWKTCFLSFTGQLQLLKAVISSIVNFWMSAYCLPHGCIDEIERLCFAFLWSGPDLNFRKAKVAWTEVCKTKQERGLGLQSIKEVNQVACLKLIWRILSGDSLWVQWTRATHLKDASLWAVTNTRVGSWMWRKILKYRDLAKTFHRKEVLSGSHTSFWFDNWSALGRLVDITGPRGHIDMGIPEHASVASACASHRRRAHMNQILKDITAALEALHFVPQMRDVHLWKSAENKFSNNFSSKATWNLLRLHSPHKEWSAGIWFKYSTPKFRFLAWLALKNRLVTGERMREWNIHYHAGCCFCDCRMETRDHLFFSCPYATEIWKTLLFNLLSTDYSDNWDSVVHLLHNLDRDKITLFLFRYVFQATIYTIWHERNKRRHGENPTAASRLIRIIYKMVRNRLISIRRSQDQVYEAGLQTWFGFVDLQTIH